MSNTPYRDERHLNELIAGKVIGDLSKEELQEFGELFSVEHSKDLQELELAAAALQVAMEDATHEAMPDSLRQRIADSFASVPAPEPNRQVRMTKATSADLTSPQRSLPDAPNVIRRQGSKMTFREVIAWLAVAASLMIAVGTWISGNWQQSAAESRLALLSDPQNVLQVDWSPGKKPFDNPVSGDVVWDNASQTGFMRFVGMPANDPSKEQYQLWIIDPERDAEPIDGGVFDVASSGEVVIPIQAKLKVLNPAAFAITIEQPGGVVVSTQDNLPLLALVSK